jgi:FixJ family two-component response regulator
MPVMTKTPKGDIVILARKEYDQLIAAAVEDAADAEAARRALDRLKKGEHSLTSAEMDELLAAKTPRFETLSPREQEVMSHVTAGKMNKQGGRRSRDQRNHRQNPSRSGDAQDGRANLRRTGSDGRRS